MTRQLTIGGLTTSDNVALLRSLAKQQKRATRESKEDLFAFQCRAHQLPAYTRQAAFAKQAMGRHWRADFCFESYKLLVEIDGLVPYQLGKGRHQTIGGQEGDMRKGNAAIELGYAVLHFSQGMVKSGEAIERTVRVLAARGWRRE